MGKPCWKTAGVLLRRNFSLFLSLAIIETLIELWAGFPTTLAADGISTALSLLIGVTIAYVAHLSELAEQSLSPKDLFNGSALPNRSFLMVSFVVGVSLLLALGLLLWAFHHDLVSRFFAKPIFAAILLGYFLFLCRWGTIFAAAVLENRWTFKDAHDRGRRTFWPLMMQLLHGSIFGMCVCIGLMFLLTFQGAELYPWTDGGAFSPSGAVLSTMLSLAFTYVTLLGVVAFCNAYQFGERHKN